MNAQTNRSNPLLGLAALMALVLSASLVATALVGEDPMRKPTVSVYSATDGELEWERDAVDQVWPVAAGLLVRLDNKLEMFSAAGEREWTAKIPDLIRVLPGERRTATAINHRESGKATSVLDTASGATVWESPGWPDLSNATIIVIDNGDGYVARRAEDGVEFARYRKIATFKHHIDSTGVAYITGRTLNYAALDGSARVITEGLGKSPRVEGMYDDVALVSTRDKDGGRTVHAYEIQTDALLWSGRFRRTLRQDGEGPVTIHEGSRRWEVDIRTGNRIRIPEVAGSAAQTPRATAVRVQQLASVGKSTRYLTHGNTTYAVDVASGEVRWNSGATPLAATDGIVAFRDRDRMSVVSEATGAELSSIPRDKRDHVIAFPAGILLKTGKKLLMVSPDGSRTPLADLDRVPQIVAHSRDHVAVWTASGNGDGSRRLFVYNVTTGQTVLERTGRFQGVELAGGRLELTTLDSSEEIDLAAEEGVEASTYIRAETMDLSEPASLAVFDPEFTHLLWSLAVDRSFHLDVVGDSFMVVEWSYNRL